MGFGLCYPDRPYFHCMRIAKFVLLTALLSAPCWYMARAHGSGSYTALLMWCPAFAAAILLKAQGKSLGELGWQNGQFRWILLAGLTTILTLVVSNSAVFLTGLVEFPNPDYLVARAKLLGVPGASLGFVIPLQFLILATSNMIMLSGPAFGEELGWRGFLVPEACKSFGFKVGALLSGLIWSVWHLPLLIGNASAREIACFLVAITSMGVAFAYFRMKSASVWPSTLMHAVHNALVANFFVKFSMPGPAADLWLDETGYALAGGAVLAACLFLVLGTRMERATSSRVA